MKIFYLKNNGNEFCKIVINNISKTLKMFNDYKYFFTISGVDIILFINILSLSIIDTYILYTIIVIVLNEQTLKEILQYRLDL